jgi:hypothetical protein
MACSFRVDILIVMVYRSWLPNNNAVSQRHAYLNTPNVAMSVKGFSLFSTFGENHPDPWGACGVEKKRSVMMHWLGLTGGRSEIRLFFINQPMAQPHGIGTECQALTHGHHARRRRFSFAPVTVCSTVQYWASLLDTHGVGFRKNWDLTDDVRVQCRPAITLRARRQLHTHTCILVSISHRLIRVPLGISRVTPTGI